MRASPQTPANEGQSFPQWITPCYNGVGVGDCLWSGLLDWREALECWAGWSVGLLLRSPVEVWPVSELPINQT